MADRNKIPARMLAQLKHYPVSIRLQKLRGMLGLTQKQFAEQIGIRQGSLSRWERGATKPQIYLLQRIVIVYDLPIDFFVDLEVDHAMHNRRKEDKK